MKKNVLMLMVASLLSGTEIAADSVPFTINGNITQMTCSVSAEGGNTITMQDVDVTQPVLGRQNAILSTNSGRARVRCPLTRNVTVTITQTAGSVNGNTLVATNAGTGDASGRSAYFFPTNRDNSGVVFRLYMKEGSAPTRDDQYSVIFGQSKELHTATGTNYTTYENKDYYLVPAYQRLSSGIPVTPGEVSAHIQLAFTYH